MKGIRNIHNIINKEEEEDKVIIKKEEEGKYPSKRKDDSPTFNSFLENSGIITDNEYEVKSEMNYNTKSE